MASNDDLATRLIVASSRFARAAGRRAGQAHSLIAMRVLGTLTRADQLRVGELATREGVTQPAMTATVNRLAEEGLVEKRADPRDARAAAISITDAGRGAVADFRSRSGLAAGPGLDSLAESDLQTLRRAAELIESLADELDAL